MIIKCSQTHLKRPVSHFIILQIYESIDISKEEREIRKQFNLSHEDITYKDFQELSREQLKVFFNYMIDHITIREMSFPDDPKVMVAITIYLKLNGYSPKGTLEYLFLPCCSKSLLFISCKIF